MHRQESAEALALRALAWLAGDRDRMLHFLNETGASPGDLAGLAGDSAFLGSVLDHILSTDELVMGFCDSEGIGYDQPMQARAALPGGQRPNWT